MTQPYRPLVPSRSRFIDARGLRHHVRCWGDPDAPLVVMAHGWMDISASFQFVVDCLARQRHVMAPDWRGFGLTQRPVADCYWFPDYMADLDRLLDVVSPESPVDLVGHSMGGNVTMLYAGVRPARVRRLINLEGFGLQPTEPAQAPARLSEWLDELKAGPRLRHYQSLSAVAERLMKTNARLPRDKALWLAAHWSARQADGQFALLGDPAHKLTNPYLYRVDETLAVWRRITAPVLLVGASDDTRWQRFVKSDEYRGRLSAIGNLREVGIPDAGHMLHHDQPARVAELIEEFIDA